MKTSQVTYINKIAQLKKPVAIAMWDFSWLLRHHRAGEFENWDKVLDELVERGYDAIRIDCFPYLVATDNEGKIQEEFLCPKGDWSPAFWGNQYTTNIRPRQALLEFLPKCRERGVKVGLATWFQGHGTGRNEIFNGVEGLVRAWDETLSFLKDNDLLDDNILYVDLLNEYPLNHSFNWLRKAMLADERNVAVDEIEIATVGNEHIWSPDKGVFKTSYHCDFLNRVIECLSSMWPDMNFFASLTPYEDGMSWDQLADISKFTALDMHIWFVFNKEFITQTKYWEYIHSSNNDVKYAEGYNLIRNFWKTNKEDMIEWMKSKFEMIAQTASKYSIPCGNTEGWGTVVWNEHPDLDWGFIKESAEICAKLGVEYGFKFNCTSNFTHPQFPGIWKDVEWHKRVTSIIKNGY